MVQTESLASKLHLRISAQRRELTVTAWRTRRQHNPEPERPNWPERIVATVSVVIMLVLFGWPITQL